LLAVLACGGAPAPAPAPVSNAPPSPAAKADAPASRSTSQAPTFEPVAGSDAPEPVGPNKPEAAVVQLEAFARRMCACPDAPCARAIDDEIVGWSHDVAAVMKDPSPEQMIRMTDAGKQYTLCRDRRIPPSSP
jgi:hypothetical protein